MDTARFGASEPLPASREASSTRIDGENYATAATAGPGAWGTEPTGVNESKSWSSRSSLWPTLSRTGVQSAAGSGGSVFEGIRVSGLESWQGYISDISDGVAVVRMQRPSPSSEDLVGEFPIALLGEHDQPVSGDIVYVTARTVVGRSGYPHHTTSVRLQRSGRWTVDEVERIEHLAQLDMDELQGLID